MILTLINIILVVWIYFYLLELKRMNCKCAFTPQYYFIVVYIILSLVFIFLSTYMDYTNENNITIIVLLSFIYFIFTITFVFSTFSYIRYIESTDCECANTFNSNILSILAWLRILSFVMIIVALIILLCSKNTISDSINSSPIKNSQNANSPTKLVSKLKKKT